ncbi:hypothetical protein CI109_106406 [Kwoniella shandongensis]|uniref:Uncharacterized protein n=1 Tax=Kwoniella shandongensis TaxID=1734106 RepID=A0A5M6BUN9_9TREE|nr:uncharacterized protein CI109_005885 [Kwoniella shandongensis]KAA5525722.1 hypothetical protein CI109_005885 [Kwoniella shandongensis]
MYLIFARHGQTEDNVQGIIQGHKDTPLNNHGRLESARLAERLRKVKIAEAYTSPLCRAKETAEIVLRHHPGTTLSAADGLKERGLGSMEGRRRARGEKAPADAESYESLGARSIQWFDSFLASHEPEAPLPQNHLFNHFSRHSSPPEPNILIVSHGAWLSFFLSLILSPTYGFTLSKGVDPKLPCYNTSLMVVGCKWIDGKWKGSVDDWGDISHLRDMMEEEVRDVADDVR